ncbi:MAG: NAD(P)/FAD-dependent oxidoreductase [Pseudomonadota bacterium]
MHPDFDGVVVGGGIIGLAIGRALSRLGHSIVVLEAEAHALMHTSSRNSEVIHAGIYYPTGSLKAETCVSGKQLLYDYCSRRGIPHRRIGKFIVAVDEADEDALHHYRDTAESNGVVDLEWRDASFMKQVEPEIRCSSALWSPSTGIIDTHTYAQCLQADLESESGMLVCNTTVDSGRRDGVLWVLQLRGQSERVRARFIVNAAGLRAVDIARRLDGLAAPDIPEAYFAVGHYYALSGGAPFHHLIYPTAGGGGLGVHVTLDLAGQVRFGPDVRWIDDIDYTFDDSRRDAFEQAIRRYYPGLEEQRLVPAYTGVRPKISGPADPSADFIIDGPERHGVPALVNLFGIESPGITASLAVADLAVSRLAEADCL